MTMQNYGLGKGEAEETDEQWPISFYPEVLENFLRVVQNEAPGLIEAGVLSLTVDGVELKLDPKRRDTSELEQLVGELKGDPAEPAPPHPDDERTEGGFRSVNPEFRR